MEKIDVGTKQHLNRRWQSYAELCLTFTTDYLHITFM